MIAPSSQNTRDCRVDSEGNRVALHSHTDA